MSRYESEEHGQGDRNSDTDPPYSRLFVICGKSLSADELRPRFEQYGKVEDIFVVRDRTTGESKGVCYVKFDRTSSAALAQEALHNTTIGSDSKPIRIVIAASKHKQTSYDINDDNSRNRLFVVLPKEHGEDDLKKTFSCFEGFDSAYVVKDHNTKSPKGFGYVKFSRASLAALAMENCDTQYRALIAEPKDAPRDRGRLTSDDARMDRGGSRSAYDATSLVYPPLPGTGRGPVPGGRSGADSGRTRLYVIVSTSVTSDQLSGLCDVAPGMTSCKLKVVYGTRESRGFAFVTYDTPANASFALARLNHVEYPLGTRLVVKYAEDHPRQATDRHSRDEEDAQSYRPRSGDDSYHSQHYSGDDDRRRHHSEEAAYRPADYAEPAPSGDYYSRSSYSQEPPVAAPRRPAGEADGETRLFFVGSPAAPPDNVLQSVFGHFGDLIDAYVVRGHNYGYVRFSRDSSALRAMQHLNQAEVAGNRLKVMRAEPPPSSPSTPGDHLEPRPKRSRY